MPRRRSATSKEVADIIVSTAALEERVGNLIDEFQRERDGAAQHRRDLREVIGALSGSVQELTRQMLEAKPLWKDYEERRAEARAG